MMLYSIFYSMHSGGTIGGTFRRRKIRNLVSRITKRIT